MIMLGSSGYELPRASICVPLHSAASRRGSRSTRSSMESSFLTSCEWPAGPFEQTDGLRENTVGASLIANGKLALTA
jgi:hypothetical protein